MIYDPQGSSPFESMMSAGQLHQAWQKVRANGGGPGGDGESIADFAGDCQRRLARLAHELATGLYRPGPLRRVDIRKKSGGSRRLSIPCVVDRVAQTSAAMVLSPILEPHFEDASYAYRPGRSVAQAVMKVDMLRRQGYHWVVDGDFEAYFDTIPHDRLLARLGRYLEDEKMLNLVRLWLAGAVADGTGVPQGSPISPLLSNLYLDDIDEAIESRGVRLVRFADDFVLLCKTEPKAQDALARMEALCGDHGLKLNRDKTRIVGFDQAFDFLGRKFVRSLVVNSAGEPRHAPAAKAPRAERQAIPPETILIKNPQTQKPDIKGPQPAGDPAAWAELSDPGALAGGPLSAGIIPLYVLEHGRRVRLVNHGTVEVSEGDRVLLRLPLQQIGRIELGAHVEAEDGLLRAAAAEGVSVHFLNGHGGLTGSLVPTGPGNSPLHLAQARLSLDTGLRLAHAARLVAGRLANSHALLKRLNRRRKLPALDRCTDRLQHLRRKTATAQSLDQLRGMEGEGAAGYWRALNLCLEHGWAFERRDRHPAGDPVNAVFDWTASLLARDVRAAVTRAGLHPGFGTLHSESPNKEACVFDLIEEFRSPLCEALTIYLFNNRVLQDMHFVLEADHVHILPEAGTRVIEQYEHWLARPIRNPATGKRQSWRSLILFQAHTLGRCIGAGEPYTPYRMDY